VVRARGGGLAGFPRDGARSWSVAAPASVTVGSGRLVYVRGRSVRAVRLRDGLDRELLRVPRAGWEVAAGAFGVALAGPRAGASATTVVYRLPWRQIDRVLGA
jgi:hypothetical protein